MPINVADFDLMIKNYMIARIKGLFPNLDTSDDSVFDDMFIKPMQAIIAPLINIVNALELKQNLNNAAYLSETELDELIQGNYLIPRKSGQKSVATVTLSFASLPSSGVLTIYAGTTFSTTDKLVFQNVSDKQFTLLELYTMYNTTTMTYDVSIDVESEGVGANYNVGANRITICDNWPDQTLVSVINKTAAIGGTDKETNVDYANRALNYYISRHLGTPYGYKQFILETFEEVQDVYVAGYGNKFMDRDIIFDPASVLSMVDGTFEDVNVIKLISVEDITVGKKVAFYKLNPYEYTEIYTVTAVDTIAKTITLDRNVAIDSNYVATLIRHIGGKVDIYVKGCDYESHTIDIQLNSNNLFLQTDYDKIIIDSFNIQNSTDSTKTVTFTATEDEDTGKCVIKLLNPDINHLSYDPDVVNTINVYYRYLDANSNEVDKLETFTVGLTQQELLHPFKDVIEIKDTATKVSYTDTKYFVIRQTGLVGTSKESAVIRFIDAETDIIPNGHTLQVLYSVNETINNLGTVMSADDNRVVTTDVLFKEAERVYVNMGFQVKLKTNESLDDFKINTIKNSIANFFLEAPLGQQIQESDIIAWLYADDNVNVFLDFITLPFTSFYIADDISAAIETRRDGTFLSATEIQYPVLNKISITAL